jgi:hypothetical protein
VACYRVGLAGCAGVVYVAAGQIGDVNIVPISGYSSYWVLSSENAECIFVHFETTDAETSGVAPS